MTRRDIDTNPVACQADTTFACFFHPKAGASNGFQLQVMVLGKVLGRLSCPTGPPIYLRGLLLGVLYAEDEGADTNSTPFLDVRLALLFIFSSCTTSSFLNKTM
jgi:hypothetical protein